jgi:glucan biosynthesis protein C
MAPGPTAILAGILWRGVPIDFWISHLWFLVCLAYYFLATALGAALLRGRGDLSAAALGRAAPLADRPVVCLLLLPLGNLAVLALFAAFPMLYSLRPLVTLDTVAGYLPFFVTGLIVFANPRLYESLTRFRISVAALTAAALLFQVAGLDPAEGPGARLLEAYRGSLWTWIAVYWVLVFFRAVLDRPSPTTAMLANASYTIYLFHHLTVILIAWWLTTIDLGIGLKFVIVMVATFALTLGVHMVVIRPVPLLTFLFNGRRPDGRGARA